jgi:hypothetical protein
VYGSHLEGTFLEADSGTCENDEGRGWTLEKLAESNILVPIYTEYEDESR